MTTYTKKELSELLDIPIGSIRSYCSPSKKKLIVNEDDVNIIDDSIDTNKLFIEKKLQEKYGVIPKGVMRNNNGKKKNPNSPPTSGSKVSQANPSVKKKKVAVVETAPAAPPELSEQAKAYNDFTTRKNALILEKMEKEIRRIDIDIEKKEGDFIKTADAIKLFEIKSAEFNKVSLTLIERLVKKICVREEVLRKNSVKYVAMVPELVNEINKSVQVNIASDNG